MSLEEAKQALMALKEKYGADVLKVATKEVVKGSPGSRGVAAIFRKSCPSIEALEGKGYNFYIMSSNFQELCEKEGIQLSEDEIKQFDELQRQNLVVGRFWKSKGW
jgi:hypothetical protein